MFKPLIRLFAALAVTLGAIGVSAQTTKLNVGYVPAGDWLPALVAKDKGLFDKRNLDVTLTKVAIISNVPSAILSGSLHLGVSTPTVLIDAADAGLPLVGVAGGTRFVKNPAIFSVVVRQGLTATSAKDLEGKRVGVPGLRSIADVLFRKWLLDKGVNLARVNIVEAPFPQMRDLLKGGTLDAVAVLEPFRSRIVADNTGFRLADYVAEVNPDVLGGVWVGQREWALANPRAVTAFRESLAEAIDFIKTNNEEARAIELKYLGFSTPVLLPYSLPVSNADLETYVRYAREVGYLSKPVDVSQMLVR
ncbi:ABC transporter substrate-binding protein [Hydrogenophaga sp. OTU3427]|uniref:ABC transporter substrate-binding protein n=1 Tax=Hydrogenophaga sp. OTU3427 TaxID=3043856 RepID=UPI00313B0895